MSFPIFFESSRKFVLLKKLLEGLQGVLLFFYCRPVVIHGTCCGMEGLGTLEFPDSGGRPWFAVGSGTSAETDVVACIPNFLWCCE